MRFAQKTPNFVGIFVDIFVCSPMCTFVSTLVREFVGQISRFAISVLFRKKGVGERPIEVVVLLGVSVGCLAALLRARLPYWKTAPPRKAHYEVHDMFKEGLPSWFSTGRRENQIHNLWQHGTRTELELETEPSEQIIQELKPNYQNQNCQDC